MKIILRWLILAVAIFVTPYVVSGVFIDSFLVAVIAAACLAFINLLVKPIVQLLTLPINLITLGLFSLIINGFFFWLLAKVIRGFDVSSFGAAILGALIVSIINWLGGMTLKDRKE